MSLAIIEATIEWIKYAKFDVAVISGGEPTASPYFEYICKELNREQIHFMIASNGTWCESPEIITTVYNILKLPYCVYLQVYSNAKWYKDYELVISHKNNTLRHPKIHIITDDILSMQDLGRAKTGAIQEVEANPFAMSCLKSTVLARQCSDIQQFAALGQQRVICTPMVDYIGNVHMSESCLCPSCGNLLTNTFASIWDVMHSLDPCLGCKVSQRFMNSNSLKAAVARKILGL